MSTVRSGFSLIEAMVAVVIIGVVGTSAMAATAAQNDVAYRTKRRIEATTLAEYRLAEIGVHDNTGMLTVAQGELAGAFAAPFDEYTWSATVRADDVHPDMFKATVIVRTARATEATLTTQYYRPAAHARP